MTEDDDEPDFFSSAYARHSDPDTSHEAAHKMSFTDKEQMVYAALAETGVPMTSLCVARALDVDPWSVSPRFKPLEDKGAIERCGKLTVLNSSGNIAALTAWRIRRK
jgi:Mn-dependent DtxR family transcriptional regulator